MRKKPVIIKALVAFLFAVLTVSLNTMPTYAWKVKTHVYSSNLIIEEIKANNGYVEIEPYGMFQVIPEYKSVILAYPEYYRAGALGPDQIPDILVGQTIIHPGTEIFTSGQIIEILWDEIKNLPDNSPNPANDPASKYLRINNKQQAQAFVLGCMAHAAGDYFGHSYINNWSGGPWPEIMDGITPSEMAIITRHNVIEAYIDEKIPNTFKSPAYNSIKIPQRFVFDNMIASGTVNMDVLANDSRAASRFGNADEIPMHMEVFFDIRSELRDDIMEIDENMSGDVLDVISSVLTLEFAQKAYMKAWIEDIDEGLGAWVAANERAAQQMVSGSGMSGLKDELSKWADDHLLKMLGAPDVAADIINTIGDIAEFVEGLLPDALTETIKEMKFNFVNFIFKSAFDMDLNQFMKLAESPATAFNRTDLFPAGSLARLNNEMGNFNTCTNAVDQSFIPFQNTLTFMKLILIGEPGIAELRRVAGSKDTYRLSTYTNTLTEFIDSFDVGYTWKENPQHPGFLLWQGYEDINKITKVIFNLNGITPKPSFSNMSKGPITIIPGPRPADSVPNITVSYTNAPGMVNTLIGLYPAGNFSAQPESWQYTGGKASGTYSVTTPFKGGKYQFRIYDTDNRLLAVSDTIEVLEDASPQSPRFTGIPTEPIAPDEGINYNFMNPQKKTGFYSLYKEGETDPTKHVTSKFILNGKATSISGTILGMSTPGRYQFRAYDENNVLFAQSAIITIAGSTSTDGTTSPANPPGTGDATGTTDTKVLTLKATSGPGYVKLDWNNITDPKGVSGYHLYRSTASGKQSTLPETDFPITGTTYTDTKLQAGTTYYYILKPVYKDRSTGPASNEVSAAPGSGFGTIELTLGNPYMKVNGVSREIDPGKGTAPETKDGRTCLPIRAVAEAMGATVGWDNAEKKVTLMRGEITVEMWIGKKIVRVNGKDQTIDVAPYSSATGRTMIPLRFAGESLGGVIAWDNPTKTATIVFEQSGTADNTQPPETDVPSTGWSGVWFTDFGRMELVQSGNSISGFYGENKYTIKGTVSGNILTGTITENGSVYDIRFVLADDSQSFSGVYDGDSEWEGERDTHEHDKYLRTLPQPVDFSGTWETDFGTMVLKQSGNTVTGTYDYDTNCVITGTVVNNKLIGKYYERKGSRNEVSGLIEFYMFEDGQDFIGWYGDDQTATQDWSGWDGEI